MGYAEKIALVFLVVSLAMKAAPSRCTCGPDAYAEAPAGVTCLLVAVSQASCTGFSGFASPLRCDRRQHRDPWTIIIMGVLSMFIGVTMAVYRKR